VAVDHVLHPALEFGSDKVLDVNLIELFGINLILICYLNLWISNFNQVSFHGKRLRVLSQIFLLVENGIYGDQFGAIL